MDMTLPKAVFVYLLVTASTRQTATDGAFISRTPARERRLPPLFRLYKFHRPTSQSQFLNVWTDLDDIWPEFNDLGTHHDQFMKPRPNHVTSVPQSAQRCQGGFVKYDDTNNIQNKFDIEERQLQLRENKLRKDRDYLNRMKREDHENRARENKRRLEELEKEENRRLEEQRLKEDQQRRTKIRQQHELRAREEQQQRMEEQRRIEKERQETRIKRDMAKQRHTEERAQQQQKEAEHKRQMQEQLRKQKEPQSGEYRKQSNSRKGQHSSPHSSQQFTAKFTEITSLNVPEGYDPEDISIETVGNQMFTKGSHVCSCDENCLEREFERRISLPDNIDTHSLAASLHHDGRLSIQGTRYRHVILPVNTEVPVKGLGLPPKQRTSTSCKFNDKKTGFKLKKMNARTGEVLDDIEPIPEVSYPLYEKEVDDDGLTIEVVD